MQRRKELKENGTHKLGGFRKFDLDSVDRAAAG